MAYQPFLILSDVHFHNWSAFSEINKDGVNSRLQHIIDEVNRASRILKSRGGNVIYLAGDVFHVRGKVEPSVLNPVIDLFDALVKDGFEIRAIPGNHDLATEETTKLGNAMQALQHVGVDVQTEFVVYKDHKLCMIPWTPNLDDLSRGLKGVGSSDIVEQAIIHAPLNDVIKGIPDTGLVPEELASYGFKRVFCGHYHNNRHFLGDKVISIGATSHQTWSDVNSKAGFLLVYPDHVEHYRTHAPLFVDYDSDWESLEALERCAGNYVRVNLGEATGSEVTKIREHIKEECKAKAVIVKAVPKQIKHGAARISTVKSGARIEASIAEWVKDNAEDLGVSETDLVKMSLEVLNSMDEE